MSSFIKDLSSRRAKVFLFCLASGLIIFIGAILLFIRGQSSSPRLQETLSTLSATDENGNKWSLELVTGQQLSGISKNNKKPGPPLLVSTNTIKINNYQVSIGIKVEGQAGERYIGGAIKNGKRVPEPQFIIMDEKARILARDRFDYG
jgi:hypothetical protein